MNHVERWLEHVRRLAQEIGPLFRRPQNGRPGRAAVPEHPAWGAHPVRLEGGNTEMADALRAGIPAIAISGQGPNGEMPYWHQVEDTVDKLDPEVMERAYAFIWAFLQAFDSRSSHAD